MNGERVKMIRNSYKSFESKNKKKEESMMREKRGHMNGGKYVLAEMLKGRAAPVNNVPLKLF